MTAWWITGDTRAVMADMPAGSVDLVLTSPPFLALRSYLPDDDPGKQHEMGSEANPAEFVDALMDVTELAGRLLTPHGTLCVELGDTYSGSAPMYDARVSSAGTKYGDGVRPGPGNSGGAGWPLAKSLALVPEAYRMALAYGRNPHNGRPTDPWRIRNVIRWVRPNPPVGALGDKFRPATSEMVVACKSASRWFDLDAVRTEHTEPGAERKITDRQAQDGRVSGGDNGATGKVRQQNPAGSPPLDWWKISPDGYPGAHYAMFPAELCVKPIEAMCPRRVCLTCRTPSRRLVDTNRRAPADDSQRIKHANGERPHIGRQDRAPEVGWEMDRTTTGWSTCGCPGADGIRLDGYHTGTGWRPGVVLDPFGGSGTTAMVASGHGRESISIDLDARNVHLARERIGMFFQETTAAALSDLEAV